MKPWSNGIGNNLYGRGYKHNSDSEGDGRCYPDPAGNGNWLFTDISAGKFIPRPPGWTGYSGYGEVLGVVLQRFPDPSYQFLVSEGERGNDQCPGGVSSPPYGVTLNDDPAQPPWASLSGQAAFRHLLPPDQDLYQQQARANYLFIDGHVDNFGPNDTINDYRRFAYKQR
jgi:prepilin-type processing-associated H-X9-DG protein